MLWPSMATCLWCIGLDFFNGWLKKLRKFLVFRRPINLESKYFTSTWFCQMLKSFHSVSLSHYLSNINSFSNWLDIYPTHSSYFHSLDPISYKLLTVIRSDSGQCCLISISIVLWRSYKVAIKFIFVRFTWLDWPFGK